MQVHTKSTASSIVNLLTFVERVLAALMLVLTCGWFLGTVWDWSYLRIPAIFLILNAFTIAQKRRRARARGATGNTGAHDKQSASLIVRVALEETKSLIENFTREQRDARHFMKTFVELVLLFGFLRSHQKGSQPGRAHRNSRFYTELYAQFRRYFRTNESRCDERFWKLYQIRYGQYKNALKSSRYTSEYEAIAICVSQNVSQSLEIDVSRELVGHFMAITAKAQDVLRSQVNK
jgi:hypothetical protein